MSSTGVAKRKPRPNAHVLSPPVPSPLTRKLAAAPNKGKSPPALAKAAVQAKPPRSAVSPAAPKADDGLLRYSFTALRDKGGAIVLRVVGDSREAWVGAHGTALLRLRPAAEHPELARKVTEDNNLLVSEWAERLHELRALVAWGVPVILRSGKCKALGTLHEEADLTLVKEAKRRLRKRVRGQIRKVQEAIREDLAAMRAELAASNRWAQEAVSLMRELPSKCTLPEPFRNQIELLMRQRAYEGEVAKVARPDERDLPRY